ncbi:hypothetical protein [Paraburkholderia sp.]|uniref:hypothetical protein n=1 Tax=Paraburkholderia sp. TaxID=1926495 RepID=UPI002D48F173|nr:hypothetical protein [Paraburkholderia sp.]HZZ03201.1 hypothetical protein [Paraburkholderia sp.]
METESVSTNHAGRCRSVLQEINLLGGIQQGARIREIFGAEFAWLRSLHPAQFTA